MVAEQNNVVTGMEMMAMCLYMAAAEFKELLIKTAACSCTCSLLV